MNFIISLPCLIKSHILLSSYFKIRLLLPSNHIIHNYEVYNYIIHINVKFIWIQGLEGTIK